MQSILHKESLLHISLIPQVRYLGYAPEPDGSFSDNYLELVPGMQILADYPVGFHQLLGGGGFNVVSIGIKRDAQVFQEFPQHVLRQPVGVGFWVFVYNESSIRGFNRYFTHAMYQGCYVRVICLKTLLEDVQSELQRNSPSQGVTWDVRPVEYFGIPGQENNPALREALFADLPVTTYPWWLAIDGGCKLVVPLKNASIGQFFAWVQSLGYSVVPVEIFAEENPGVSHHYYPYPVYAFRWSGGTPAISGGWRVCQWRVMPGINALRTQQLRYPMFLFSHTAIVSSFPRFPWAVLEQMVAQFPTVPLRGDDVAIRGSVDTQKAREESPPVESASPASGVLGGMQAQKSGSPVMTESPSEEKPSSGKSAGGSRK